MFSQLIYDLADIYHSENIDKLIDELFHKDIDYSELVEYIVTPVPDEVIRAFLIDVATDIQCDYH